MESLASGVVNIYKVYDACIPTVFSNIKIHTDSWQWRLGVLNVCTFSIVMVKMKEKHKDGVWAERHKQKDRRDNGKQVVSMASTFYEKTQSVN